MSKEYWKPGNMLYPVPPVMVSCASSDGKMNIITIAWTGTICTNPPMVSISVRPERYSYGLIKNSGEFVINLTTRALAKAADYCGVKSGREVDKFKECGLTMLPSKSIKACGIAQSPVNIECKVTEIKKLGSHDLFLAQVTGVTVDTSLLDKNNAFQLAQTDLITYVHGEYYTLGQKVGKFGYSVQKKKRTR